MKKKYKIVTKGPNKGRIKALRSFGDVKKGDLGGFVESETNLSHDGDCWIYDDARAVGNSRIMENAKIRNGTTVCNSAVVRGCVSTPAAYLLRDDFNITDYGNICGVDVVRTRTKSGYTSKISNDFLSLLTEFGAVSFFGKDRIKIILEEFTLEDLKTKEDSYFDSHDMDALGKIWKKYKNAILEIGELL